jgi:ABC-type oligopeptide transport system ATPase subunit
MKVVNIFGGPGTGKSTTAAGLFYLMKISGYNVELVTEYAKDMTWEDRHNILGDQLYILAKQNRRLERLRDKVDWVITDSPVIMGVNYAPEDYYDNFVPMAFDLWNSYDNINFYLVNNGNMPFQKIGRNQTKEEAKLVDKKIFNFLKRHNVSLTEVVTKPHIIDPFSNHVSTLFDHVKNLQPPQFIWE